jgi:SSS family transporter
VNAFDYSLVAIYLLAMLWFGIRFRRSRQGVDYFLGGRGFGPFSLSMSTMATQLSAISFISAPAFVGLRPGGGMHFLTFEFGVPLAMIVIMVVIGPMLYRSGVVSVYSFLEQRFGSSTRLLLAGLFVFMRTLGSGIAIHMMCVVLTSLTGIALWQIVALLGVVSVIYSLEGGMKAVVYSEVAQMVIMVSGILLIVAFGLHHVGGWSGLEAQLDRGRLQVVDFSNFGFDGREFGFWPMLIGGFFLYISYYGTDQTQAQRALSARDEGTLRRMLVFNGLFRFPVTLCYCVGGLILGTFAIGNAEFRALIPAGKPDLMIPVFVSNYLPHGVIGIIVVALIAAGMSSYSATLNSVSAVVMEDFVSRFAPVPKERYVAWSKLVSMVLGVITLAVGFFADRIAPTAIEAINKVGSLVYGPILGIFLLAALGRWIKPWAGNTGVVVGLLVNLYLWIFCKQVFWLWWNVFGTVITVAVGSFLSLASRTSTDVPVSFAGFVHARPGRDAALLLLYFLAMLGFAIVLPRLIAA